MADRVDNIMEWDDSAFQDSMDNLTPLMAEHSIKAITDVGAELLRLSQIEVPHDKGWLQNSGTYYVEGDTVVVGYHTPYAARLHEHPEYHFQAGRKGKYLEGPMKNNLTIFRDFYMRRMREVFGA